MEASLRFPADRISGRTDASVNGCGPRRSCDHSQRADTVDLISARVDVQHEPACMQSIHMRNNQELLAKTGRDCGSERTGIPEGRQDTPSYTTGSHSSRTGASRFLGADKDCC
jgi:hypothetical protein